VSLHVSWRIDEELAVIDLSGKLTLGPSLGLLQKTSRQILKDNKVNGLIIRLAEVSMADSSGLGELTQVYSIATNRNCGLRLLDVPPSLRKMLQITCIDELLPESKSLASAKAELKDRAKGEKRR
jgi:anti-anti-sigma factor